MSTRSVVLSQRKDCSETWCTNGVRESDAPDDGRRCGA